MFVALQPHHRLKTDGFYALIRHPSYLGMLTAMAGWALVFRSMIGLLLVAAMCVPITALIRAEEDFLAREFGKQYRVYQQHTRWRLLPFMLNSNSRITTRTGAEQGKKLENPDASHRISSPQDRSRRIYNRCQKKRSAFSGGRKHRGCAIQLQHSPDRPGRSPAPYIQSRPRQPRPSSCLRTQSKYSRSTGNGSPQIVGRRTPSDAVKTEHFAVTRPELLHVHLRGLIHVRLVRAPHVGLVRNGTLPRCILLYLLRTTLNVRLWLSTHVCARLRFCLRFARLLRSFHLLPFCRCSSLWFFRLPLRLLWLRLLT